jgi:hypothetical protein
MKLTKDKLKNIIKEELEEMMSEQPQQQSAIEFSPEMQLQNLLNTLKGRINTLKTYKEKLKGNQAAIGVLEGEIKFLETIARVNV